MKSISTLIVLVCFIVLLGFCLGLLAVGTAHPALLDAQLVRVIYCLSLAAWAWRRVFAVDIPILIMLAATTATFFSLLLLEGSHLVGRQEAASGPTWSAHGVIVSRFVQIRLARLGGQPQLLLESLPCNSSLQYTVKLFCVDV